MINRLETADQYIADVLSGKEVVCNYVRLAVKRHVNDLKTLSKQGYYFDRTAAQRALTFFDFLKHSKGKYAGQSFILDGWQSFIVSSIYGWKKPTGFRRFNEAYVEVAKKNGKTTLSSGLGNLSLVFDNEPGAEVYAAAYTRDQANICFDESVSMVSKSPHLSKRIRVMANTMSVLETRSKFQAVSHDAKNTEGKNAHFVSLDEFHVHKTGKVKESLRSGMAARMQPLFFTITTAGDNQQGPCFKFRTECVRVLEGQIKRENLFAIIFTLDDDDDWTNPKVWGKANPSLGKTVNTEFIAEEIKAAQQSIDGEKEVEVKTKHLNMWVGSGKRWIKDEIWTALPKFKPEPGDPCYGGLDLASVNDFTAWAKLYPPTEKRPRFGLSVKFYIPRRSFEEKVKAGFTDLVTWERDGWITVTEKKNTDYDVLKQDILSDAETFDVQFIGYDRWNSSQLVNDLNTELGTRYAENDGKWEEFDRMDPYGQGFASISSPAKEFQVWIESDLLSHDHNPAMRWMMGNVMLKTDEADNIKLDKKRSPDKIDGPLASVIAAGEYLTWNKRVDEEPSGYESGLVIA